MKLNVFPLLLLSALSMLLTFLKLDLSTTSTDVYELKNARPASTDVIACRPQKSLNVNGAPPVTFTAKPYTGSSAFNRPVNDVTGMPKWSVAANWFGGVVPTGNGTEDVIIPKDAVILLDDPTINVASITVEGKLIVDITKANITIKANTIMVDGTATGAPAYFQWGTDLKPYTGNGNIILKGTVDMVNSFTGMGTKVFGAMAGGIINMRGQRATSWTQLSATALGGQKVIKVRTATQNWSAGDTLVIASTDFNMGQAEKVVIASVAADKKTITLVNNLSFKHYGEIQTYSQTAAIPAASRVSWTLDESAEVGLLSKSITIRGDENSTEASGFGGHVMINSGSKAYIRNVAFYRMGQRYIKGRYPFHWHNVGDGGTGQFIDSCSVYETYNRAITVHATNDVFVRDNVAYNNSGHAYFLEDGTEHGVTMTGNLGLVTKRPTAAKPADTRYEILPSDIFDGRNSSGPATFWITNPNNKINDNHAAGSSGSGIWYAPFSNPDGAFFSTNPLQHPLNMAIPDGNFDNNVMHSNRHGFIVGAGPKRTIERTSATDMPDENQGVNVPANSLPTFKNIVVFKNALGAYTRTNSESNQESKYINFIIADNRVGDAATWRTFYDRVLWVVGSDNASTNFTSAVGGNNVAAHIIYDGPVMTTNSHFGGTTLNTGTTIEGTQSMFDQWGANKKYGGHTFNTTTVDASAYKINFRDENFNPSANPNLGFDQNPVWFLASVVDVDGKLTGTPNTTLSRNLPYLTKSTGNPVGYNGVATPNFKLGYVEATGSDHKVPSDNSPGQSRPNASILRSDEPQYTDQGAINGYPITTVLNDNAITERLVLKQQIPARMRFDFYSHSGGQDAVLEYPNVPPSIKIYTGDAPTDFNGVGTNLVNIPQLATRTMAALLASTANTSWYWNEGTAYIRYKAPAGSDFTSDKKQESIYACLYGGCINGNNAPVVIANYNTLQTRGSLIKNSTDASSSITHVSEFNGADTYVVNPADVSGGKLVEYSLDIFGTQNWQDVDTLTITFIGSPSGVVFLKYADATGLNQVPLTVPPADGGGNTFPSSIGKGTVAQEFLLKNVSSDFLRRVKGIMIRTRDADVGADPVTVRIGEIRLNKPASDGGLVALGKTTSLLASSVAEALTPSTSKILIYPNPSNGIFRLSKPTTWQVFDIYGKRMKYGNGSTIDLTQAPRANYVIKFGDGSYQKIVTQ